MVGAVRVWGAVSGGVGVTRPCCGLRAPIRPLICYNRVMAWSTARFRQPRNLSALMALGSLVLFLISTWFGFGVLFDRFSITSFCGCLNIMTYAPQGHHQFEVVFDRLPNRLLSAHIWTPTYYRSNSGETNISIPYWIPLLLSGGAFVFFHRKARRLPGYCAKCGYSLIGNTSGVCPECGTAAERGRGNAK